jgi:type IV pilus assembly protein PilB
MSQKLGEKLVEAGVIKEAQLHEALAVQKRSNEKLGTILVRLKFIDDDDLTEALSQIFDLPSINLDNIEIEPKDLRVIPADVAKRYKAIPVSRTGDTLTIAIADPSNFHVLDDIKFMTGLHVEAVIAPHHQIEETISKYYGEAGLPVPVSRDLQRREYDLEGTGGRYLEFGGERGLVEGEEHLPDLGDDEADAALSDDDYQGLIMDSLDDLDEEGEEEDDEADIARMAGEVEVDAPIVKLVNGILIKAVKQGVSDVHFEPYEKSYRVRYRLDGVLRKELSLPLKIKHAVTSRVKIMAELDIAEKRLPQDGRIKLKMGAKSEIDFRVSTLPTLFGEKVVLRILDKANLQLDMTALGFTEDQLSEFQEGIHKPFGMVLVTGPTGSGKTTTLYSALNQLNTITENTMTAEDPVEYNLPGINQVQMQEEIGMNFANALRAFLRQDPDIIMVGEIRDFETAEIAIKAALTGHLVLSTIHTNDAPSTINRLLNMGIEPFLVSSSLNLVLAQRLVRKICLDCKEPVDVAPESLLELGFSPDEIGEVVIYKGRGCTNCNETGYRGRVALYEVMTISDEIRELILRGASAMEIKETAVAMGMVTLRDSGMQKCREGQTSIEEVVRVTYGD